MKLAVIAALLGNTQALSIRADLQTDLQTETGKVQENCMSNYERTMAQGNDTLSGATSGHLKGGQYEDPSFPADMSSMYWMKQYPYNRGQVHTYYRYEHSYGIAWKRPTEIMKLTGKHGAPSLWGSHGVSVQVSEQGADGDCWFLSTHLLLLVQELRESRVFTNKEYAADGAFQVKLFVRGEPISVIVDDRIPVLNLDARYVHPYPPVNSRPSKYGDAWWLVILEKAMAKLNINYVGINGGTPGEAFRFMTGMPVVNHSSQQMRDGELWDLVTEATHNNWPMGAGTRVSNHGLIAGHAYGVLGSQTLTSGGKVVHQLVKMRNPWGNEKYIGDWSDDSKLWTAAWRKEAGVQTSDDGIFFVPLDQWRQDWASISICHHRDNWHETQHEGNPATFMQGGQTSAWIGFDVPEDQDVMLECTQTQDRLFPGGCTGDEIPQRYGFILYNQQLNQLHTNPGMGSCNGDAMNIKGLKKGSYQVRVVNFDGNATGHTRVWKMRAFADKAPVSMHKQSSYVYKRA